MNGRVGILGFGVVGASVLRFLKHSSIQFSRNEDFSKIIQGECILPKSVRPECPSKLVRAKTDVSKDANVNVVSVWDSRTFSPQEQELIKKYRATDASNLTLDDFFSCHDYIVVSPGIDVRPYQKYYDKIINELDLFSSIFKKSTIAITGTLGKTTVTKLLGFLLPEKSVVGGNVGTAMLDLVEQQESIDTAVLELSSFQLEKNSSFAPDVAIWTNVYPNHLNRHRTMDEYCSAKANIFVHQRADQFLIVPIELCDNRVLSEKLKHGQAQRCFIKSEPLSTREMSHPLVQNSFVFYVNNDDICKGFVENEVVIRNERLCAVSDVPDYTFIQNWLCVLSALNMRGVDIKTITSRLHEAQHVLDEHRLEHFATINGIDFYNDSKATVQEATQAAVRKLAQKGRPIIVVVGGLSKGADRAPLINFLSRIKQIKKVLCLGTQLSEFSCYESYASLDRLVRAIMHNAIAGDQVLFSPSGASFDLFDNYVHRGVEFKKEVLKSHSDPSIRFAKQITQGERNGKQCVHPKCFTGPERAK